MRTRRARLAAIAGLTLTALAVTLTLPPISQGWPYHQFADRRAFLGIPNFLDVVSNIPFLWVGALGLLLVLRGGRADGGVFVEGAERWPYAVFFGGLALTSFGSAYYHLSPDHARLVWDRLPMTLIFTSFVAALVAERVGVKAGLWSLAPLAGVGLGSVVYWYWTETQGAGDLRVYLLVQVYPALAVPLLVFLFPAKYTRGWDLLRAGALYGVAKVFEMLDGPIFSLGQVVSGHTLKHLAAAAAPYCILRMLKGRRPRVFDFGQPQKMEE